MVKSWLDYLADLFSGRIHNTFVALNDKVNEVKIMSSNQEMRISKAAATIVAVAAVLGGGITKLVEENRLLRAQIENDTEVVPVTVTDDELAELENAVAGLEAVGNNLHGEANTNVSVPDGPRDNTAPGMGSSPIVQNPVATNDDGTPKEPFVATSPMPEQQPAIPLAGETGIANTPSTPTGEAIELGENEVYANQPQPGTSGTGTTFAAEAEQTTTPVVEPLQGHPEIGSPTADNGPFHEVTESVNEKTPTDKFNELFNQTGQDVQNKVNEVTTPQGEAAQSTDTEVKSTDNKVDGYSISSRAEDDGFPSA